MWLGGWRGVHKHRFSLCHSEVPVWPSVCAASEICIQGVSGYLRLQAGALLRCNNNEHIADVLSPVPHSLSLTERLRALCKHE